MSPRPLPPEVIVATMEALLIEGLAPTESASGDDSRAVEYLEAEDPELEKRNPQRAFSDGIGAEGRIKLAFEAPAQLDPQGGLGAFWRFIAEHAELLGLVGEDPLFWFTHDV